MPMAGMTGIMITIVTIAATANMDVVAVMSMLMTVTATDDMKLLIHMVTCVLMILRMK